MKVFRIRLVLFLLAACSVCATQGKRAPDLKFAGLDGSKHRIGELRGTITVVNFWATWCGPCREELPMLSRLTQQYAGKKVRFIAISTDDDAGSKKQRAKIDRFLAEQKFAIDVWLGADVDALGRCGLGNILPGTMILDESGQVITRVQGQAREADVTASLDWLLNGRDGPAPDALIKRY